MGVLVAPVEAQRESAWASAARRVRLEHEHGRAIALASAATALALGVGGYHPYAEDGGIYLAGVKRLLDPRLYPHDAVFAMEPARWSLFAPFAAGPVRLMHLPLPWVLLLLHVASVWATLFAAWMLAKRCFVGNEARAGAVVLLACWLGLPVAGTALYVMDPYLTARSFATPAMIFAIVGALDATAVRWEGNWPRPVCGWTMWLGGMAACAAMHPLMAMYAAIATVALVCVRERDRKIRVGGIASIFVMAVAATASAQMLAPPESAEYVRAELSRSYWFLREWHWYEVLGLIAPIGILSAAGWMKGLLSQAAESSGGEHASLPGRAALARTAVVVGLLAWLIAVLFAREDAPKHLVARMQPLRMFQIVYVVMIVMLGGWLGERILLRSVWRWCATALVLGGAMFTAARAEYPGSNRLEMPWIRAQNAWVQAFEWVRANTPKDALFAIDADYIHAPGEDAQSFRAIAERSVLPDASKDGGEASIAPDLAEAWEQGMAAQQNLDAIGDAERVARLQPLGVTWVVLDAEARTRLECPYANASVRICRLP